MFGVPSLSNNPWLVGAAGLLGSIGGPMWTIAAHSLLGRKVPSPLLGRVSAAYSFLGNGIAASGPVRDQTGTHVHTFLVNETTGEVWRMECKTPSSVQFLRVPVQDLPSSKPRDLPK